MILIALTISAPAQSVLYGNGGYNVGAFKFYWMSSTDSLFRIMNGECKFFTSLKLVKSNVPTIAAVGTNFLLALDSATGDIKKILPSTLALTATNSVTGDGSAGAPVKLVNDVTSPGITQYYGTNTGGTRGWQRSIIFELQNAAFTTNATPATAYTVAIEDGTSGKVTVTFLGYVPASNEYVIMKRSVAYKKQSGTLTLGTVRTVEIDEVDGLSSSSGTLNASSNNINADVTGQVSKSIQWAVTIKWEKIIPAL